MGEREREFSEDGEETPRLYNFIRLGKEVVGPVERVSIEQKEGNSDNFLFGQNKRELLEEVSLNRHVGDGQVPAVQNTFLVECSDVPFDVDRDICNG